MIHVITMFVFFVRLREVAGLAVHIVFGLVVAEGLPSHGENRAFNHLIVFRPITSGSSTTLEKNEKTLNFWVSHMFGYHLYCLL